MDAWRLGVEASTVIALRTIKIAAGGPDAQLEATRMIEEKIGASLELQSKAMTGGLGFTPQSVARQTLDHYHKKVRSNRKRLSK